MHAGPLERPPHRIDAWADLVLVGILVDLVEPQAVVDGQLRRDAPLVLRVDPEERAGLPVPSWMLNGVSETELPSGVPSVDTTSESVLDTLRSPSAWNPLRTVCCPFTRQLASVCSPVESTERAAVCDTPLNND